MRLLDLRKSTFHRLCRPSTWGAILMFGLVWALVRLLADQPFGRMGAGEFLVPALVAVGHLALSALPWQWTGDERRLAPLWRGYLQAFPWNAAWLALLLFMVQGLFPQPPRAEAGPPRVQTSPAGRLVPAPSAQLLIFLLNLPFAMMLGWFLAEKERAEAAEAEQMELARRAQARALQAQLHPHALYNVLGGLTELVHEDPDAAEEALVGLVEMLRMLTRQGTATELPLAQERALLRHYLAIEQIRLGPRLQVKWQWPEWADALHLPPLLLQPLVENAIRHGIAPCPEGGALRIGLSRSARDLVLRVSNTGRPLDPQTPEGTGLGNLRKRLALMPRLEASLELRSEEDWTVAELRLREP